MRFSLLSFFLLLPLCFTSYSQETPPEVQDGKAHRYVPLHNVREKGIKLTREDSLAFKYAKGDTLVLITPAMDYDFPKGVQVRVKPQDSLFIEKYKAVVFGPPNMRNRDKQNLKIWKDGIRLYFDPSVPEKDQQELWKFTQDLSSRVDSLSIKEVKNRADANYLVFYKNHKNDFDLEPRITNKKSGYYLNWTNNWYLSRGSLKINRYAFKDDQAVLRDLKKRFFETLGYFRTSDRLPCGSLLSECGEERSLSKEDLEILKYHYSYQNCYGLGVDEFESNHARRREIFAENPRNQISVSHILE